MKAITESGRRSRNWLRQQGLAVRGLLRAAVLAGVLQTLAIIAQMGLTAWLVHALLIAGLPFTSLL